LFFVFLFVLLRRIPTMSFYESPNASPQP